MERRPSILVCFAVKEEAAPFLRAQSAQCRTTVLLTGIGPKNAQRTVMAALASARPELVLSCGFAGGLRPELATGTVLFEAEGQSPLADVFVNAGARQARFHCLDSVANAEEKRALWKSTGADAVEMESRSIRAVCRENGVQCVTMRVVLDTANEDLPLDFNKFMTPDLQMDYPKLALAILKAPQKIPSLLQTRQRSLKAARSLAQVLEKVLVALPVVSA